MQLLKAPALSEYPVTVSSPEVNELDQQRSAVVKVCSSQYELNGLTPFLRLVADTDPGLMLIKLNDLIPVERLLLSTVTPVVLTGG